MNIKNITALIQREYWENRGLLFVTPLVISIIIVILTSIGTIQAVHFAPWDKENAEFVLNGERDSSFRFHKNQNQKTEEEAGKKSRQDKAVVLILKGAAIASFALSFLLSLFYLSQSLHQDRKDKSILFWRSLPISEWETISSKLLTGMLVFPAIFLLFSLLATIVSGIVFYVGTLVMGLDHVFKEVVIELLLYSPIAFLRLIIEESIITFSLLPVFCWFLFASSFSKKSPLLIAIGIPLAIAIIEVIVLHSTQVIDLLKTFSQSTLESANAISSAEFSRVNWAMYAISFSISVGLLFATYWLRNNKYEL